MHSLWHIKELSVVRNHVAIFVELTFVREHCFHFFGGDKFQVGREVYLTLFCAINVDARKFSKADGADEVSSFLELSLDSLLLTGAHEGSNMVSEIVGEEVPASTRSPIGVGDVIDRVYTISQELDCQRRGEAVSLRNRESGLRHTHDCS